MMSADAFSAFEEVSLSNRKELSTVGKRYFNFDVNTRACCQTSLTKAYHMLHMNQIVLLRFVHQNCNPFSRPSSDDERQL